MAQEAPTTAGDQQTLYRVEYCILTAHKATLYHNQVTMLILVTKILYI